MTEPLPPRGAWLRDLLFAAGESALAVFGGTFEVRRKADASPVTDADLAAEAVLVAGIRAAFATDRILSEECGEVPGGDGATWVVDPIDGTSAFTEGLGHWGPTVARILHGDHDRIEIGGLYLPRLHEHYHVEGRRGWMNGHRLPAMTDITPKNVLYLPSAFHRHFQVEFPGKTRCLGGTAAHLALVARGAAAAVVVPPAWSLWDTAAGLALIDALGGKAVRFPEGTPLDPFREPGVPFIAGFPGPVAELLRPGRLSPRAVGVPHAGS